jgi:hypothetical protein
MTEQMDLGSLLMRLRTLVDDLDKIALREYVQNSGRLIILCHLQMALDTFEKLQSAQAKSPIIS